MSKFITIASGKGGTGKTTTAINLAKALTNFGRDVIVVDGNVTTPNIGLNLGTPFVKVNLHDVLKGKNKIDEAIYKHASGIKVVPAGISLDDLSGIDISRISKVFADMENKAEIVIVDSAAGLGKESITMMGAADEIFVVTTPDITSVTDSLRTIKLAEANGGNVAGVIVNKVIGDKLEMTIEEIEEMLEQKVIGIIPYDNNVRVALKKNHPVLHLYPNSKSSVGFKKIAALLVGEKYGAMQERLGFFSRIFGFLRQ